ncbi:MAG TPA: type II 3-dehydroquinate dehydratase [Rubricoccaceae bacterium]|nr:type II 3-dehydroquinate dehydratase [Rubricoccaceae bacterium]
MKLLVLNGPNLDRLGRREPEVYGTRSLAEIETGLRAAFPGVEFVFFQSNHEGALVDALHAAGDDGMHGVILNAAGYSHTSVALRDAIAAVRVPVVEVHLTNVHAREPFRHTLLTAGACAGVITGLGPAGYHLAVRFFLDRAPRA